MVSKNNDFLQIGHLGLLERENAAILNESLKPLAATTVDAFTSALDDLGMKCPVFLTQNDGTMIRYVLGRHQHP